MVNYWVESSVEHPEVAPQAPLVAIKYNSRERIGYLVVSLKAF